jgi:hypothetical protein
MMVATVEQTRKAAAGIADLQDADFKKRKSGEAGDVLVGFFAILAKKLFPQEQEVTQGKRVELMLAAWFLRGDLEQLPVKPPDEAAAKKAVDKVAALKGDALDKRMTAEVGDAVLAFFSAFAKKVMGKVDDRDVQLMVLAFLLRRELAAN